MKNKFLLLLLGIAPLMLSACDLPVFTPGGDPVTSGGNNNQDDDDHNDDDDNDDDKKDSKYTILIYMSANDLESGYDEGYGYAELATEDLKEICSVEKPEDYNIVIETGGCSRWATKYGIRSDKISRYHVENKTLKLDGTYAQANMGKASTLQSFIEYGIKNYKAEKMALVYWNHGGALDGVCFDENYDNDSLTADECLTAYRNAFGSTHFQGTFEWVGYDACLMAEQDIAYYNKDYFKYMVCSQEAEAGYGWDYDAWLPTLYNGSNTATVLKKICDTFIEDNNYDEYGNYTTKYNDQTLSVLDLSKMDKYMSDWESMVSGLSSIVNSSSKWSSLKTIIKKSKQFGADENGKYYYDVYNVKDFFNNMSSNSTYSSLKSNFATLTTDLSLLVINASNGAKASTACGLNFFCPLSGENYKETCDLLASKSWKSMCETYGTFYTGGWGW